MRARFRQLWVTVLSVLILFGMGLQALPVPCQSDHCGTSCGVACASCPPSCTCHLSVKLATQAPPAAPAAHCGDVPPAAADQALPQAHCSGGVSVPGLPDFALPNPPPAAVLSAVADIDLASGLPPAGTPPHERAPAHHLEPPDRPPAA